MGGCWGGGACEFSRRSNDRGVTAPVPPRPPPRPRLRRRRPCGCRHPSPPRSPPPRFPVPGSRFPGLNDARRQPSPAAGAAINLNGRECVCVRAACAGRSAERGGGGGWGGRRKEKQMPAHGAYDEIKCTYCFSPACPPSCPASLHPFSHPSLFRRYPFCGCPPPAPPPAPPPHADTLGEKKNMDLNI